MVAERYSTGIPGLDAHLRGGVPAGSLVLIIGQPSNALELLPSHLAAAASRRGAVRFHTTEQSKPEIDAMMARLNGEAKAVTVSTLPRDGRYVLPDLQKGRADVLHSFSVVADEVGWKPAHQRLRSWSESVRRTGDLLVVTAVPDLHEPSHLARLRLLADVVMELAVERQGFGLYPYLRVSKARGLELEDRLMLFKETPQGLVMESTRRVF